MKILLGRFACWLGKHRMRDVADKQGGILYRERMCLRCGYFDESASTSELDSRWHRRRVARAGG